MKRKHIILGLLVVSFIAVGIILYTKKKKEKDNKLSKEDNLAQQNNFDIELIDIPQRVDIPLYNINN